MAKLRLKAIAAEVEDDGSSIYDLEPSRFDFDAELAEIEAEMERRADAPERWFSDVRELDADENGGDQ